MHEAKSKREDCVIHVSVLCEKFILTATSCGYERNVLKHAK